MEVMEKERNRSKKSKKLPKDSSTDGKDSGNDHRIAAVLNTEVETTENEDNPVEQKDANELNESQEKAEEGGERQVDRRPGESSSMMTNNQEKSTVLSAPEMEATSIPPLYQEYTNTALSLPLAEGKNLYPNSIFTETREDPKNSNPKEYKLILTDDHLLKNTKLKSLTHEKRKEFYNCYDLENINDFEDHFLKQYSPADMETLIESENGGTLKSDPLYQLLAKYHSYLIQNQSHLMDIEKYQKKYFQKQEEIWKSEPVKKTFSGQCGDNVTVKETATYDVMKIDEINFTLIGLTLTAAFDTAQNVYCLHLNTKVVEIKINELIEAMIASIRDNLIIEETIHLQLEHSPKDLEYIGRLRKALQILFHFTRKTNSNKSFMLQLQVWIDRVVAVFLRIASKQDHWFLIMHLLRLPNGVGSWARKYIQLPSHPSSSQPKDASLKCEMPLELRSPEVNLYLSMLKILLMPIKQRNNYLKEFNCNNTVDLQHQRWTFVDSDGEDIHSDNGEYGNIKETDLISFINQIPFGELFKAALGIEQFLGDYIITKDSITSQRVLSVFAFCNELADIIVTAQDTYNTVHYKQFVKHLTALLKHTLEYATDYYILYRANSVSKDIGILTTLVVEYHVLLLKICKYIYAGRNLSTWQYFGSLPYEYINQHSLWQLFYYLNVGFPETLNVPSEDYRTLLKADHIWNEFNLMHVDTTHENLYYLLQAFQNMATQRDEQQDSELIETICQHIFNIGFINENTREMCYKAARDVLVDLTQKYPNLFSVIMLDTKKYIQQNENILYLYKFLPLNKWQPSMKCYDTMADWLLHYDITSIESQLSRFIIGRLNWNGYADIQQQTPFLEHSIHVRMACVINEALTKHAPEVIGVSGISENVLQITNHVDFSQSSQEQFSSWCWSIISRLHLHLMDQSATQIKQTLQNPAQNMAAVPSLELITSIHQDVLEHRPLATYLALLISWHGHSIPWICQKGFDLMQCLIKDYRHAVVIRSLQLIIPLFLECPDVLSNCSSFHAVMKSLLNADQTYLKVAKDTINGYAVGPVLKLFEIMLVHQITSYQRFGFSSPLHLINVWLHCLTNLPNWHNTSAVHLLEQILRVAYQFSDVQQQVICYMKNYYRDCTKWKTIPKRNTLMGLLTNAMTCSDAKIPEISPNYPWLALLLIEIEFNQVDQLFWPEFIRELSISNVRHNLKAILKKTLIHCNLSIFPVELLCIYKLANLLASMDPHHVLFPIINQKFFELYLSRVSTSYDNSRFQQIYGVSNKLYDFDISLMKKIKSNLLAAQEFHASQAKLEVNNKALSLHHRHCENIMKTFALWLEDNDINKLSLELDKYPPQYNADKLKEIFQFTKIHWTEYLYFPLLYKSQRELSEQWALKCLRLEVSPTSHSTSSNAADRGLGEDFDPIIRIKTHLKSYEPLTEAPTLNEMLENSNIDRVRDVEESLDSSIWERINKQFDILKKITDEYETRKEYSKTLHKNCMETIKNLYRMCYVERIELRECQQFFRNSCKSPARIILELMSIEKVESNQSQLYQIHDNIIDHIKSFSNGNCQQFAWSVISIENIVNLLLTSSGNDKKDSLKTQIGLHFFYEFLLNYINDTPKTKFQPITEFFIEMVNKLKELVTRNQEKEIMTIAQISFVHNHTVAKILEGIFQPNLLQPKTFIEVYKYLLNTYESAKEDQLIRLYNLLEKFDIVSWLNNISPQEVFIDELLLLIVQGLQKDIIHHNEPQLRIKFLDIFNIYKRHLIDIFEYKFPLFYIKVLQMVLEAIPKVLHALFESYMKLGKPAATTSQIMLEFVKDLNHYDMPIINDGISLFTRFFKRQRLQLQSNALGVTLSAPSTTATEALDLYTVYGHKCVYISEWMSYLGRCLLLQITTNSSQDILPDQICDTVFGSIIEFYTSWLAPYSLNTIRQQLKDISFDQSHIEGRHHTALSILNDDEHSLLQPWPQRYDALANQMMRSFIYILKCSLELLPESQQMLSHAFAWYIYNFSVPNVPSYIYQQINTNLLQLPWNHFKPSSEHITLLYEAILKMYPEVLAVITSIFLSINWNVWFKEIFTNGVPSVQQTRIASQLFNIFVRISFEPAAHNDSNMCGILQNALGYPWHLIDSKDLEALLQMLISTVDPKIILKCPEETNYVDRAILDLLRVGCAMTTNRVHDMTKRILYVRSILTLQLYVITVNPKLLGNKKGTKQVAQSFDELLKDINHSMELLAETLDISQLQSTAFNYMKEIIQPMQTQAEKLSNLQVTCIIRWQTEVAQPGNILMHSIFHAVNFLERYITNTYELLESTIFFYFRATEHSMKLFRPSWTHLVTLLRSSFNKLQLTPIIYGNHLHLMHLYFIHEMHRRNGKINEQNVFLEETCQFLDEMKSTLKTEPELILVWCAIITQSCRLLQNHSSTDGEQDNTLRVCRTLTKLAKHLQLSSNEDENWSRDILGAIGLTNKVSIERKILSRCLAIFIYSILPANYKEQSVTEVQCVANEQSPINDFYGSGMRELSMLLNNRRYTKHKVLIVQSISYLKEHSRPQLIDVPQHLTKLLAMFYHCPYVSNTPEVWLFDFQMIK